MEKIKNYINGELVDPIAGNYIDNYNPSTGAIYSLIPDSDAADVELATKAANAAFPAWSKTPKEKRSRILQKLAFLIEENLDRFTNKMLLTGLLLTRSIACRSGVKTFVRTTKS